MHDESDSSAAAVATTNANFGSRRSVKRVTTFMVTEKEDASRSKDHKKL